MAGSIKWFVYQDDEDKSWAVKLDKSNALAGGFTEVQPNMLTTVDELPRGRKMRYVNVVHPASGAKRKLYLGQPTNPLTKGGQVTLPLFSGNQAQGVTFFVSSYRGERKRVVFGEDTGLTDAPLQ